jgi:hypothetical protein
VLFDVFDGGLTIEPPVARCGEGFGGFTCESSESLRGNWVQKWPIPHKADRAAGERAFPVLIAPYYSSLIGPADSAAIHHNPLERCNLPLA